MILTLRWEATTLDMRAGVMGQHELGVMNKLVLGGSVFPHRIIQKVTWLSSDEISGK